MANMWAILLPRIFPSADVSDLVYGFRERFVPMGQTLLNKAEFEERDYTTHAAVVKLVPDTIPRFDPFFPAPACPCSKPQSPAILSHSPMPKMKQLPFISQSHGRGAGSAPGAQGTIPSLLGFSAESLELALLEAFGVAAMEHPSWIYAQHKWNLHEIQRDLNAS